VHRYYENVLEASKHLKKELEKLMTKAIDDKRKSYDTILGKWCL